MIVCVYLNRCDGEVNKELGEYEILGQWNQTESKNHHDQHTKGRGGNIKIMVRVNMVASFL